MRAQHWIQWYAALITLLASATAASPALAAEPAASKAGTDSALPADADSSAEASFTPYVERTIPVPPLYFVFSLNLTATRPERPEDHSTFGAGLGFSTGIVDRLTAEATVGPLELLPDVRLRNLRVGLLYDLINTRPFELEPTVHVTLSPGGERLLSQIEPGLIMAFHGGRQTRFDTGVYLPISRGEETAVGFTVPARAVVQVTRHVHAAMSTGAFLPDLTAVRRSAAVPLGFAAGYSVPLTDRVGITVTPSVSWPSFLMPFDADPIHTGSFVVAVVTDLVLRP
jgi:hypothetical protein